MKKSIIIIFSLLLSVFVISSCGNKSSEVKGEEEHEHSEHEDAMTASLTAEQVKSIGLEIGTIEQKQLTASLKANGILKVPNQNRATVTAMSGGTIKSILVQPGNSISKGQVVATIVGTAVINMQEEYISVSAKSNLADLEFNRQKELQQGNASALKLFQQSEAEAKSLKARKASLQKQLELIGVNTATLTADNISSSISIVSPINGAVSDVMVNIGSFVEANSPIAEIVDNSQLHVDLYVYEKDLSKLKEGQTIHFTLTNNPGKEYDAKIYGISNTFEANTKAVAVHAQVLGDKSGLIDGMSITAIVSLKDATVNAVPSEAIVSYEGQDFIFVVTDSHNEEEHHHDEAKEHDHEKPEAVKEEEHHHEDAKPAKESLSFDRVPVAKGTTDIGYTEITLLKDIPANAKIVTKGAFFVLGKMTNAGEGHEH